MKRKASTSISSSENKRTAVVNPSGNATRNLTTGNVNIKRSGNGTNNITTTNGSGTPITIDYINSTLNVPYNVSSNTSKNTIPWIKSTQYNRIYKVRQSATNKLAQQQLVPSEYETLRLLIFRKFLENSAMLVNDPTDMSLMQDNIKKIIKYISQPAPQRTGVVFGETMTMSSSYVPPFPRPRGFKVGGRRPRGTRVR